MRVLTERFETELCAMFCAVRPDGALAYLCFLPRNGEAECLGRAVLHLERFGHGIEERPGAGTAVRRQVEEFLRRARRDFDLVLAPEGTPFQLRVWRELARIPYSTTISYAELARRIDNPRAVRAVGGANGRNPISLIVPCHRVIGADGSMTGFGGGVPIKRALLAIETEPAQRQPTARSSIPPSPARSRNNAPRSTPG